MSTLPESSPSPEKIAPVQGYTPGIPWSLHLEAYDAYRKRWGAQEALIDLEGRNCRGGFHVNELDEFIPGWRDKVSEIGRLRAEVARLSAALASSAPTVAAVEVPDEVLVLLIEHDGEDSPSVALARNRAELLEQVKVAVWGEPHPADTTNDAGDDMAEGMTDTLLETGVMTFEGDPPLRLVRIPVTDWLSTPAPTAPQQPNLSALEDVIQCLRAHGRYVDEEGETTNRLHDLLTTFRETQCK